MRVILFPFWIVLATVFLATAAHAHGGGSFRGPPRPVPNIRCDCGHVDCARCSRPGLAIGSGLSTRETTFQVRRTWGDLAEVRIEARFQGANEGQLVEGHVRIAPAPLLAVTAGRIESQGEVLAGVRAPAREATRGYLWRRWRSTLDPLLVRHASRGSVDVRAFPIRAEAATRVRLDAFVLLAGPGRVGIRIYRTGDLCLVIQPLSEAARAQAVFVDEAGNRALSVLDVRTARRRHPDAWGRAVSVPCVPALEAVLRGGGDAAVTPACALVALPPGPMVPRALFVGPASEVPTVPFHVPPGSDPLPPPPPPPPAPVTPPEGPPVRRYLAPR